MKCGLAMEKFSIDMKGNVVSSWCGAENYGNIYDNTFVMPLTQKEFLSFDYCNNPCRYTNYKKCPISSIKIKIIYK